VASCLAKLAAGFGITLGREDPADELRRDPLEGPER
jgi:hypothetical protein